MPIYEYACAACGHEFEEWQKMSDAPVRTCPKCKKKKVEKLISRTAFQLKGSGWYADLYSSSKPGSDSKAESKSEAKSDSKSDSSPADGGGSSAKESSGGSDGSAKGATKKEPKKKESAAKKAESRAA
jgi:putative FmdB family regulatory protein